MKTGWLLYDRRDYEANRMFAAHMIKESAGLPLSLSVVFTENFHLAIAEPPDFVISRQRNPLLSIHLELMGIPVFNNARVCEICNDKRNTYQFLRDFERLDTEFTTQRTPYHTNRFPRIVKPAFGHGGDRVTLVSGPEELRAAIAAIDPVPSLIQQVASDAGRDLRVYVLFGKLVAGVMRTAQQGIISNYKRGASVALHTLTEEESMLARQVIDAFASQCAPLSFAGIDMLYHNGRPVVNEIEDIVGSRMLYAVSDIDIIALYIRALAERVCA